MRAYLEDAHPRGPARNSHGTALASQTGAGIHPAFARGPAQGGRMGKQFEGKVALVTGGASGIGLATAVAFAREGARVVVADVSEKEEQKVADLIRKAGGQPAFHVCDVTQSYQVRNVIDMILENFGRLDFACNDAGIEGATAATAESSEENWDRVLAVNLTGAYLCTKYEIQAMLKGGGGSIVNISSIAGMIGFEGSGAYVASKHGLIGLTRTAALEYAKRNIRVNAICPGVIQTPMIDRATGGKADAAAGFAAMEPIGRFGQPEEVASAVLWLCSSGASFTTGAIIPVDGGWTAK
jgi:NAD(P)-dependent dehydrogenase (short-subunit alcohol dehydrogenase family)